MECMGTVWDLRGAGDMDMAADEKSKRVSTDAIMGWMGERAGVRGK